MTPRRGSIRDCLQRVKLIQLPYGIYPFSRKWKFNRSRHQQSLDCVIAKLRVLADDLESALQGEIND